MIKQTLVFCNPASLSLKDRQLVIKREGEVCVTRPIEDIGFIVIESQMVHVSIPLFNALAENNVSVILCNGKMMPSSIVTPLVGNTTQGETYRYQIEASLPTKKSIWKQIVEAKIYNQAQLLYQLGKDGDELKPYWKNVKSGDTDNREGAASRIYWRILFGNDFFRERGAEDAPNCLLNYGYAILRAAVARALVGSGLSPVLGVFHRNRYNAFPLADDVMEPYRPFVDQLVYELYQKGARSLTPETKRSLLSILTVDVGMGEVNKPLSLALSSTTASLVRVFSGEEKQIQCPLLL
ncbi:MAG: type II CRISPR-associated endonuclease Cas1 [Bacteroidales bacterium]|nr:type II CRISPR-associated endonuclease Cas1 [Bacteroidales bacterium]